MKRIFAFALIFLLSASFASSTMSFFASGYDSRKININAGSYATQEELLGDFYGQLRYISIRNTGGEDLTCSLYDDNQSLIAANSLVPGAYYLTRNAGNYSNFGNANFTCVSNLTGGSSIPSSNLVSFWKLDEGTGNTTADVKSANTLELPSAQGEGSNTWSASGRFYNASTLDGVNDTLRLNDSASLNATSSINYSMSIWVKPYTALPTNKTAYLWHKGALNGNATTGVNSTSLRAVNNTAISLVMNTNVTQRSVTYNSADFSTAAWSMYTVTFNGTDMKLYVNGILAGNDTPTAQQKLNWTTQARLFGDGYDTGNNSIAYFANWGYDSIMYFNTSLTAAQVAYLYNSTVGVKAEARLVAYRT